jgi:effector-binding domain-containing protein
MIDPPQIAQSESQIAAVIHLTVPRAEIQNVMRPAMEEVLATVRTQGITASGPLFSHHFRIDPNLFDFEVGVPVAAPVSAEGRVKASALPAANVARTVYHGPYDGLHRAWEQFDAWIVASGYIPAPNLWERYLAGPESSPDTANWRTELVRPVTPRP